MLRPEEIAALIEAGVSAVELAEKAGVHLRTAYKWLSRRKPLAAPVVLPPDFDRAQALNAAIDHAIAALDDQTNAAVDRLITLARCAKLLGISRHERNPVEDQQTQEWLARNIGRLLDNPPAPGEPGRALAERLAEKLGEPLGPLDPQAPPNLPPEPPAKPAENPWLAGLKQPTDWRGGAKVASVNEPPTPTALLSTPLTPKG